MTSEQTVLQFPARPRAGAGQATQLNSILDLTKALVKIRSEPNIDKQKVLSELASWFSSNGLNYRILKAKGRTRKNQGLGLLAECGQTNGGPTICLTACLDTAPIGKSTAEWEVDPLSAHVTPDNKKLIGRGSADSKVAVAIFSHIFLELSKAWEERSGRLIFLADTDEHSGRFGAIKALIDEYEKIDFVFIGYPGDKSIRIGSRGFLRVRLYIYGEAEHSGSRNRTPSNAILKAIHFGKIIESVQLPPEPDRDFEFGPKLTITEISGGGGYTNVPDRCRISIDVRLTPNFRKNAAYDLIKQAVKRLDKEYPSKRETSLRRESSWPAYKISPDNEALVTLRKNAEAILGHSVRLMVSGPSNVGNYLFDRGINATSGFGVDYENLHAANESIFIDSVMPTYDIYRSTLNDLFGLKNHN